MVVSDIKLANAMGGGKTTRACDNCISKRARWYCPADDAFLCHRCNSSVHSANPLALRHERVCLKTASMKHPKKLSVPSWHCGFTKKARTPRYKKHAKPMFEEAASSEVNVNLLDLVPEICSDDNSSEENDEQLLYRVPIFDPFVEDLCSNNTNSSEAVTITSPENELKGRQNYSRTTNSNQLHGYLPSELELEEFAADVESLLGKRLDDESFDIEGLGFSNSIDRRDNHDDQMEYSCGSGQMMVEERKEMEDHDMDNDKKIEFGSEPFELSFDFDSSVACGDDYKNEKLGDIGEYCKTEEGSLKTMSGKKILLRLDYEGVLTAWSDQKSPWTTGERPELDPNECWSLCMGSCGTVLSYGEIGKYGHPGITDGGREARVSRYREKRRTRLFTKKIRYEVRKLNAEKRPRMKGRFVKREIFSPLHSHDN